MIRHRSWIAAALLVAGCQTPPGDTMPAPQASGPAAPASLSAIDACRHDAAGLAVTTDRGIGGTGVDGTGKPDANRTAATTAKPDKQVADRGIGGTGVDGIGGTGVDGIGGTGLTGNGIATASADGIGGTGIDGIGGTGVDGIGGTGKPVILALRGRGPGAHGDSGTGVFGTVTGFRSLCLNGLDIGLQGLARLNEDGNRLDTTQLLLGQVAAIDTRGSGHALHAVGIGIRHEVSGPITAIAQPGRDIEVAGQRVLLAPSTQAGAGLALAALAPGDWVAVSGLRDLDGDVHASRLDARAPGRVLVAGLPEQRGGGWMLGHLHLRLTGHAPQPGQRVLVAGQLTGSTLDVEQLDADRLVTAGRATRHLIVEGYAQAVGGEIRLGQGLRAAIGPRFGAPPPPDRPAIFDIVADSTGEMVAVSWSAGGP